MPISREWFIWTNEHEVDVGSRVRHEDGRVGTIVNIWYGVEESIDVMLDDGSITTWYPAEGLDDVEVVG